MGDAQMLSRHRLPVVGQLHGLSVVFDGFGVFTLSVQEYSQVVMCHGVGVVGQRQYLSELRDSLILHVSGVVSVCQIVMDVGHQPETFTNGTLVMGDRLVYAVEPVQAVAGQKQGNGVGRRFVESKEGIGSFFVPTFKV